MRPSPLLELDYFRLLKEFKKITPEKCSRRIRLAVLSDAAAQQFVMILKTLFFQHDIGVEVFEAEFDSIDFEILDEKSAFNRFHPDFVVLWNVTQALRPQFYNFEGDSLLFGKSVSDKMIRRWELIAKSHRSAVIIQSNFVVPYERFFGNFDHKVPASFLNAVGAINQAVDEAARQNRSVFIADMDYTASFEGRRQWFDEKLWVLYKSPCSLERLPAAAQAVVDVTLSFLGQVVKCVVVDLDNTLWGGVIGEDGLEGIRVGHLEEGEAYLNFQNYLRQLKRRGILLDVCSKNERENALAPFRQHTDMVLKENDFAVFFANWESKAENIKRIRETLNIGFDSMVFLDDDPFERNLVRQYLPQVIVPELPEDPADYVKCLSALNLFETSTFSAEDAARTRMVQAETDRKTLEKSFSNIEDYLKSLAMEATLARFDDFHLPRIAQLIQRSNQFNLTTKRYAEADCRAFMEDEGNYFPFYVKLKDRFNDSGLISVVILKFADRWVLVDEWLMSCRVLFRGVEQLAMNFVFEVARQKACEGVRGRYLPTAKNGMVKSFFETFGFKKLKDAPDGATEWELKISAYTPKKVYIKQESLMTPLVIAASVREKR
jgi:FkbH-like protein